MKQVGGSKAPAAQSLAVRVLDRVSELTDALVRTIEEQNPGYRTMAVVPRDELWRSCRDNLTRVLEMIAQPGPDTGPAGSGEQYDAAWATGRRRAAQGMPLDDVLRSFRLGGRLVWEALIDQAHADHLVDAEGLLDVATRVWEVVDATSAQMAAAYHFAESDLLRSDSRRMATLWEGLLNGQAKITAFAYEVSRILGVPVEGPYAVVVAGPSPASTDTANLRQRLAAQEIVSVWQTRADTLVGVLALRQPTLGGVLGPVREALDAPAGVSLVVRGLAEVDTAYQQAMLARRTVVGDQAEVAALEERLPDALLLSSPELAHQLKHRWPTYSFILNGEQVSVDVDGNVRLLWVLRDILGVTGPKYGCGLRVCRACTCFINGQAFNPCSVPVSQIKPTDEITTIEGLPAAVNETLHPMQQAWLDFDVAQCGYCQPGQIMMR